MDSYVNLKKETDNLQEQIEKIQVDKRNTIIPLYEIEKRYKDRISNVLPKNINSTSPSNLVLRINLLEEEVKDLKLDEKTMNKELTIISSIKESIIEKNREQERINLELSRIRPELERRRNYVLEKKQDVENRKNRIKELEEKIGKYNDILAMDNWEQSINIVISQIIDRTFAELRQESYDLEKMLKEDGLEQDLQVLSSPEVEREPIEILPIEDELKTPKERFEEALQAVYNIGVDSEKQVEEQSTESDETQNEEVESNEEMEEKNEESENELETDDVLEETETNSDSEEELEIDEKDPNVYEYEVEEISEEKKSEEQEQVESEEVLETKENEVNEEKGLSIIGRAKNWLLEQKLKFKKKDRIALGIPSIIQKAKDGLKSIFQDEEEPEVKDESSKDIESTLKAEAEIARSRDLIKNVKYLIGKYLSALTQEEIDDIVKTASKISKKARTMQETDEYNEDDITLLKELNDHLNEALVPINMTIRDIEEDDIKIKRR